MAAASEDVGVGGEQTVVRSRFVISEKPLKPPTIAAPKNKAHKRQGIGAVPLLTTDSGQQLVANSTVNA